MRSRPLVSALSNTSAIRRAARPPCPGCHTSSSGSSAGSWTVHATGGGPSSSADAFRLASPGRRAGTFRVRPVRSVTQPGRYCDGNGLYLHVEPSGTRHWVQRLVIHGKGCSLGLGSFALVPLAEARDRALANRRVARSGGDPRPASRRAPGIPTFDEAVASPEGLAKSPRPTTCCWIHAASPAMVNPASLHRARPGVRREVLPVQAEQGRVSMLFGRTPSARSRCRTISTATRRRPASGRGPDGGVGDRARKGPMFWSCFGRSA